MMFKQKFFQSLNMWPESFDEMGTENIMSAFAQKQTLAK